MADETDTDRVIREEAAKTRRLLAWLLVGIPAAGLVVWLVVFAAASHSPGTSGGVDTTAVTGTVDTTPALTGLSTCGELLADPHPQADAAAIVHQVPNISDSTATTLDLLNVCHAHPQEELMFAVHNLPASDAATP